MKLTKEQAMVVANVELYKKLDVLQERVRNGETVTRDEKAAALNEYSIFVTQLMSGRIILNEILDLALQWTEYFEHHHTETGKQGLPVIYQLIDRIKQEQDGVTVNINVIPL